MYVQIDLHFSETDASSQGGNDQRKSGIIRLGAIKEIINKVKHQSVCHSLSFSLFVSLIFFLLYFNV